MCLQVDLPLASRVCNLCSTGASGDEAYARVPCLGRSQAAILSAFAILFGHHEAAALGRGSA